MREKENNEQDEKTATQKLTEAVQKNWPTVKAEMEKRIEEAKKLIAQGEEHLSKLTDVSVRKARQLNLSHKRDKQLHELGREVAHLGKDAIPGNQDVTKLIEEIIKLENDIAALDSAVKK